MMALMLQEKMLLEKEDVAGEKGLGTLTDRHY
jgi:hypothetical protein